MKAISSKINGDLAILAKKSSGAICRWRGRIDAAGRE
jgi:hypothetical protein